MLYRSWDTVYHYGFWQEIWSSVHAVVNNWRWNPEVSMTITRRWEWCIYCIHIAMERCTLVARLLAMFQVVPGQQQVNAAWVRGKGLRDVGKGAEGESAWLLHQEWILVTRLLFVRGECGGIHPQPAQGRHLALIPHYRNIRINTRELHSAASHGYSHKDALMWSMLATRWTLVHWARLARILWERSFRRVAPSTLWMTKKRSRSSGKETSEHDLDRNWHFIHEKIKEYWW